MNTPASFPRVDLSTLPQELTDITARSLTSTETEPFPIDKLPPVDENQIKKLDQVIAQ